VSVCPPLGDDEVRSLRARHYNSVVERANAVHDDLRVLRVRPDDGAPGFVPGQYTTLGLGNWEPRVAGAAAEHLAPEELRTLVRRAYSFACPMLDDAGRLLPPSRCDFLEFYITLVRHADDHPPSLTPRLFALRPGDRLFVGGKVTGHYTLAPLAPCRNAIFVGTGTGEAPHTAMVAELLDRGHAGRIVCVTCVRRKADLAFRDRFRTLEARYANFRYVALTTREPENLDPRVPGYVGRRYVQDYFASGDLERETGVLLDPAATQVFLCGNPAMIGAPLRGRTGLGRYPQPRGMVEVLEGRGFQADEPHRPGNVHFEKYW
jgi:ferredoxin--NADP+ reductase